MVSVIRCYACIGVPATTSTSSGTVCFMEGNKLCKLSDGSDPWSFISRMNQPLGFSFISSLINTSHEKCRCDEQRTLFQATFLLSL